MAGASSPPCSHKVTLLHHGAEGYPQGWEDTSGSSTYRVLWIGPSLGLNLQCISAGKSPLILVKLVKLMEMCMFQNSVLSNKLRTVKNISATLTRTLMFHVQITF